MQGNNETLFRLVALGIGIFTVLGAAMDWDWFMDSRRARQLVNLIGRNTARLFIIGSALVVYSTLAS